jgi:RNA polymerase sigma-70 factor (ECF subfamily)
MRRFNGRLYRTARSIVPDDDDAGSAVESAWLVAYRTIGNFSGETKLSIWLMRIVIGEALVRLRKAPRTVLEPGQGLVGARRRETRERTPTSKL